MARLQRNRDKSDPRRRRDGLPAEVPTVSPELPPAPEEALDDPAEEAIRRMVEAAYT